MLIILQIIILHKKLITILLQEIVWHLQITLQLYVKIYIRVPN